MHVAKSVLTGLLLAVTAATATTAVMVSRADDPHDPVKAPATRALQPNEITKLPPGTPVPQDSANVFRRGQFEILPAGSVPQVCGVEAPSGAKQIKVEVSEATDAQKFANHGLYVVPPYVPAGWALTEAHAETVLWSDGSRTDSLFALQYERSGYFPITLTRQVQRTDCPIQLVNYSGDANESYTLSEVKGIPAVVQHQAPGKPSQVELAVRVLEGSTLTIVQGRAIDIDELMQTASALVKGARP